MQSEARLSAAKDPIVRHLAASWLRVEALFMVASILNIAAAILGRSRK